ncbi:MAG TPA: DegV family protein [Candidatus Jeotgalibaca pullicola]|nr:DegV family protein [Candidatus Jeotgalibaca pullicola]
MKIAIVTDSTAYLPEELRQKHQIYMLPLLVQLKGESYREEIDITSEEFYEKVRESSDFPTSSQPVIGETIQLFEKLTEQYDAIISIHLSSGISGTYQSVCSLKDEFPLCTIYPFDSESSCYVQGRFVLEAARLAQKGIHPEQIIQRLTQMRERSRAYFMVDDLNNLQKGGRLSGGAALVGSMLKIKPILHFENKLITVFEKIRTQKKAMGRISDCLGEDLEKVDYPVIATVIHANVEDKGRAWMGELKTKYPEVRFELSYFGPVIGTHLGEGALGLTWTEDVERNYPEL